MLVSTRSFLTLSLPALALLTLTGSAFASAPYFNGFETNTTDWDAQLTRVASGTGGVTSATGSFHGQINPNGTAFTRWDGYNYGAGNAVPTVFQEYSTSIDIYLDVAGGWANNTCFDFSSAINNAAGTHRADFIFNGGFYNDTDGSPGSGTNRFIVSASYNSQPGSAFAKNPGFSPIAISTTGWYTFEHHFYQNGFGQLSVDMSIYNSANTLVNMWGRSLADPIASIGGNRYGWFDFNQFSALTVDNARLDLVPAPSALALLGLGGLIAGRRRR